MGIIKRAYAKLNLFLNVLDRLQTGYHLIDSLFVSVGLYDLIEVYQNNYIVCNTIGENEEELLIETNIAAVAAIRLRDFFNVSTGAKIIIRKKIPIAAGLGGGSSDAAATLLALNELWRCNATHNELMEIGLSLGADVPFCLNGGGCAHVTGIGEIITNIVVNEKIYILIVNPGSRLITKNVFENLNGRFSIQRKVPIDLNEIIIRGNDLESSACELEPSIYDLLKKISSMDGCIFSRMSGSGPTCFGVFRDSDSLISAHKKFPKNLFTYIQELTI